MLALVFNGLGLWLPFVEIDAFLSYPQVYSLPHSVSLLWSSQMYFLSVLVVVFSIVFPFFKLLGLFTICFLPWQSKLRQSMLSMLSTLGKWSYLDVFVIILLLVLANKQTFVVARVHPGIYFFTLSISLSLLLTQSMCRLLGTRGQLDLGCAVRPVAHGKIRLWFIQCLAKQHSVLAWILVLGYLLGYGVALGVPMLQIHQLFMSPHAYSLLSGSYALYTQQRWFLFIVMILTLIIVPGLCGVYALVVLWRAGAGHRSARLLIQLKKCQHWCMLDVFMLALVIMLQESNMLVKTVLRPGIFGLLIVVLLMPWLYKVLYLYSMRYTENCY